MHIVRLARFVWALPLMAALGCGSSDTPNEPVTQKKASALKTLSGSNFEIDDDANLRLDGTPPAIDWATVAEIRKQDSPSGPNDESFGQGSKEDDPQPVVVDGSIPPNKSDLKYFGVYQEGTTSSGFLNLFWTRVQEPTGTTNMDFEFNQLQCTPNTSDPDCSSNGITPLRSIGDLLITYDLSKGGTVPVLSVRTWDGTEWGPPTDLSASSKAAGSINSSSIPDAESDGLGPLDPRTFGEAQIALAAIFPADKCESFGSAYLKSRSSDTFTSALKDFVPPVPVDISNCGRVVVKKTDQNMTPLAGASFTINPANSAPTPSSALTEVATGVFCIDHLLFTTTYTIHESVAPSGYDPAADQTFQPTTAGGCGSVTADTSPDLVFVDIPQKGAIRVTKTRKNAAEGPGQHPQAEVPFTVNGVTKSTNSSGVVCFDNLPFASYTVHEDVPAGYKGEGDKTVTVDNKAACNDATYVGETVSFENTPLSDITVSFTSEVSDATVAKINCGTLTPEGGDATPDALDDVSETYKSLEPGTYNCTIVIDP